MVRVGLPSRRNVRNQQNKSIQLHHLHTQVSHTLPPPQTPVECLVCVSVDGAEELSYKSRPLGLDQTKEDIARSGRGLVFTDTTARYHYLPYYLLLGGSME